MHTPFLGAALAEHLRAHSMAQTRQHLPQRSARRSRCGAWPRGERDAMNETETDVVIVGAGCAGAATAPPFATVTPLRRSQAAPGTTATLDQVS